MLYTLLARRRDRWAVEAIDLPSKQAAETLAVELGFNPNQIMVCEVCQPPGLPEAEAAKDAAWLVYEAAIEEAKEAARKRESARLAYLATEDIYLALI